MLILMKKIKSNLYYIRDITLKRVTGGGAQMAEW